MKKATHIDNSAKSFLSTKFKQKLKFLGLLLPVTILCISCAPKVKIEKSWKSEEALSDIYRNILIVGVPWQPNMRESFENIFTETLKKHGVSAVASYKAVHIPDDDTLIDYREIAKQVNADAIITTRVLSREDHKSYKLSTGHAEYRSVSKTTITENTTTTISMSGAGIVAGEMISEGGVLEARLIDVASNEKVWAAIISASSRTNNESIEVCWRLSALITQALEAEQLIKINSKEFNIPN